ncbi:MAG TPA: hypothetical protein VKA63_04065 [Candidatus Krumholzibacteria bacterium]|nr:hypothetical protein [Candidatus Krumholzibacteria bacterium]
MSHRIGLRKEDKNEWERRAVLTPEDVKQLLAENVSIEVESFPRRAFSDQAYREMGARVVDSVRDCEIVLGVKEMPLDYFREGGAYMFFSHTIKGQSYNMPLLRRLKEFHCTLLDYELVTNEKGQRLIFFSHHAGLVGMTDSLWMLGRRLEVLGHRTPFLQLEPAHAYRDLSALKAAVSEVGQAIARDGLPAALCPFTVGILGYGRVSKGVQEILDLLPCEEIAPESLAAWTAANSRTRDRLGKVVFKEEHLVEPIDEQREFELQDYYKHPEAYRAVFAHHLQNLSLLVNAIYWEERYPRFADTEVLRALFAGKSAPKLLAVGDITCDIDGSLACTVRETEPGDPVYVYEPASRQAASGFQGEGLQVLAVGNLPSELPIEASTSFGHSLRPYLPALAKVDLQASLEDAQLPGPLQRAVILWKGQFSPHCRYMEEFLK